MHGLLEEILRIGMNQRNLSQRGSLLHRSVDYNFENSNFEYIPFGARRRIRPRITFATPVLELLLANLLYHFDRKLSEGQKLENLDMDESFGSVIKRKKDLNVVPFTYSSC
ncbi:hypothetical protein K1719_012746 [Acacia pycnantha]|nr:hypothetical protein K1719_012746 [Acacia pycnantha]